MNQHGIWTCQIVIKQIQKCEERFNVKAAGLKKTIKNNPTININISTAVEKKSAFARASLRFFPVLVVLNVFVSTFRYRDCRASLIMLLKKN